MKKKKEMAEGRGSTLPSNIVQLFRIAFCENIILNCYTYDRDSYQEVVFRLSKKCALVNLKIHKGER